MKLQRFLMLLVIMSASYSQVFADSNEDELVFQSIENSYAISERSPEMIKYWKEDKFYLKKNRVSPVDKGAYVLLDNGEIAYLPLGFVLSDHEGYFLPTSYEVLTKKPFKNVCLKCVYEWEGGVFTFRCPECYSKEIVNVPSQN